MPGSSWHGSAKSQAGLNVLKGLFQSNSFSDSVNSELLNSMQSLIQWISIRYPSNIHFIIFASLVEYDNSEKPAEGTQLELARFKA